MGVEAGAGGVGSTDRYGDGVSPFDSASLFVAWKCSIRCKASWHVSATSKQSSCKCSRKGSKLTSEPMAPNASPASWRTLK